EEHRGVTARGGVHGDAETGCAAADDDNIPGAIAAGLELAEHVVTMHGRQGSIAGWRSPAVVVGGKERPTWRRASCLVGWDIIRNGLALNGVWALEWNR